MNFEWSGEFLLAIGSIFTAVIAAVGTFVSSRHASAAIQKMERKKLEVDKFDKNRILTDSIIKNLSDEVERLKRQVAELLIALEKEQRENESLRRQLAEITRTANDLRYQIALLQKARKKD